MEPVVARRGRLAPARDYVLVRSATTRRPTVVRSAFAVDGPVDGVHPSDHAVVVADLDL